MMEISLRKIVPGANFVDKMISVQPKYGMYGYYKNIVDLHHDRCLERQKQHKRMVQTSCTTLYIVFL